MKTLYQADVYHDRICTQIKVKAKDMPKAVKKVLAQAEEQKWKVKSIHIRKPPPSRGSG